jgi:ribosomal protein S18 acetylase RimI-like enzyme
VIGSIAAASYVLEVLEDNARAIALYAGIGFVETRRFSCWTFDHGGEEPPVIDPTREDPRPAGRAAPTPRDRASPIAAPDLAAIAAHADVALAWQNSLASLRRAGEPYTVLGDQTGAAVVFPASGDLALLTVARDARRRGRGTRLLRAARACASRPLRILNVDARAGDIAAFLVAAGAAPLARQIEMVRQCNPVS